MKKLNLLLLGGLTLGFVACGDDDNSTPLGDGGSETIDFPVPDTYQFERNDATSVSFGGQTTRLKQGAEILKDFVDFSATEASIDAKFEKGEGFTGTDLNNGKIIKSKIAESVDYFASNSVEQAEIRADFDQYIADQVEKLLSKYDDVANVDEATEGTVGKLGSRLVNENGLELNQAFNKGLIGALVLDQVINDYLSLTENADLRTDHNSDKLVEGKNYTTLEHYWDEAYGYVYGASDEEALDNPDSVHLEKVVDKFLYKYIQRVEGDKDFTGTANKIFQAFKTGRAAIAAKEYDESEKQADILRYELSRVIGIRSVYYLKQGAKKIEDLGEAAIKDGSAFHDWSEGYGFIYSLRFTQNPATNAPYFSKEEVDGFIATLDAGNGFWDLVDNLEAVNKMAEDIAKEFDFTVAEAESTDLAK